MEDSDIIVVLEPSSFFFFQAEDGIRDADVTGVQTCALPIWHEADTLVAEVNQGGEMVRAVIRQVDASVPLKTVHATRGKWVRAEPVAAMYAQEIGRASCRERV